MKKALAVHTHFEDFVEDQFDFHTYCMRKVRRGGAEGWEKGGKRGEDGTGMCDHSTHDLLINFTANLRCCAVLCHVVPCHAI